MELGCGTLLLIAFGIPVSILIIALALGWRPEQPQPAKPSEAESPKPPRAKRRTRAKRNNSSVATAVLGAAVGAVFGKGGLFDVPKKNHGFGKKRRYIPKNWPKDRFGNPLD
jgi:hypothetical protein